ncbi:hypothetical protein AB0K43_01875, partial [Kitasatospora sp. NPDC049258]
MGALIGSSVLPAVASAAEAAPSRSSGSASASTAGSSDAAAADGAEQSAVVEARRTGKPVEVASKRSETVDVVAQPDGRLVATTYVQPHRVRRAGGWVDIDPALSVRADGS